jgi:O-antigen/teichoic acid export membrane protein
MKIAGKLFSGLILIGGGTVVGKLSEYAARFMVARWFGPEILGNLTLIFSLFTQLITVCILDLTSGTMHFARQYTDQGNHEAVRRYLLLSLGISLTASLGVSFWLLQGGALKLAKLFDTLQLIKYFRWMALALPAAVVYHFFFNHLLAMHQRMQVVFVRELFAKASRILGLAAVILLIPSLGGVISVYLLSLALPGICGIVYFLNLFRRIERSPGKVTPSWRATTKTIFRYSWALSLSGLLLSVAARFDIFSVSYYLSQESLGLYSIAIMNAAILMLFYYSLNEIFLPIASSLTGEGKKEEIAALYKVAVRWLYYFLLPLTVLLVVRAHYFLNLVFGKTFTAAAPAMQILILGYAISCLQGPWPAMVLAHSLTWFTLVGRSIIVAGTVILNLLLVPRFGLLGAAVAMATVQIIESFTGLLLLNMKTGIHPFSKRLVKFLVAGGGGMVLLLWLSGGIGPVSVSRFILEFLACTLVGFLVIWKIVGFSEADREIFKLLADYKKKYLLGY